MLVCGGGVGGVEGGEWERKGQVQEYEGRGRVRRGMVGGGGGRLVTQHSTQSQQHQYTMEFEGWRQCNTIIYTIQNIHK